MFREFFFQTARPRSRITASSLTRLSQPQPSSSSRNPASSSSRVVKPQPSSCCCEPSPLKDSLVKLLNEANAASGMAVNDDCKLKFLELKAKRTYCFIVFKIEEKLKQVILEKLGEPNQSYEDFTASLPTDECRYAVYDLARCCMLVHRTGSRENLMESMLNCKQLTLLKWALMLPIRPCCSCMYEIKA
ncbi:uncharacterized protein LOC126410013 [Nymphaea colorata]|nr:uncharacterized protein LOC126410013 [Nymphaea colorata]